MVREYAPVRRRAFAGLIHPDFLPAVYTYAEDEDLLLSPLFLTTVRPPARQLTMHTEEVETWGKRPPEGCPLEKTYGYTEDGMLSGPVSCSITEQWTKQRLYRNGTSTGVYLDDRTCVYSYSEEDRHGQLHPGSLLENTTEGLFDEWGFPTQRRILYVMEVLMDQGYEFDAAAGNLKSERMLWNRTELFEYDALQRLILYAGKRWNTHTDGNIDTERGPQEKW